MIRYATVALLLAATAAAEQVTFNITDLDGKTAEYQHRFSYHLTSDRGLQLAYPAGNDIDIEILGSWKSRERRTVNDSGVVVATAEILEGDSWAKLGGAKLTFEQFPFTFGQLNGQTFSWQLTPAGVDSLKPDFRPWTIRQRTDIINDLALMLFGGLMPVLPDGPVSEGDSWTGSQKIERPFYKLGARTKTFTIDMASKYTVTKVRKKGKNRIVEIEEERTFDYSGWAETVSFSVILESGKGSGVAEWEIDATRGVVHACEYRMAVSRPILRRYGASDPVPDAESNLNLVYDVELKKLK